MKCIGVSLLYAGDANKKYENVESVNAQNDCERKSKK